MKETFETLSEWVRSYCNPHIELLREFNRTCDEMFVHPCSASPYKYAEYCRGKSKSNFDARRAFMLFCVLCACKNGKAFRKSELDTMAVFRTLPDRTIPFRELESRFNRVYPYISFLPAELANKPKIPGGFDWYRVGYAAYAYSRLANWTPPVGRGLHPRGSAEDTILVPRKYKQLVRLALREGK